MMAMSFDNGCIYENGGWQLGLGRKNTWMCVNMKKF